MEIKIENSNIFILKIITFIYMLSIMFGFLSREKNILGLKNINNKKEKDSFVLF